MKEMAKRRIEYIDAIRGFCIIFIVLYVSISNDATIGAGAVVTRDIPSKATAAGVPAKVLHYDNPGIFIKKRYKKVSNVL